MAKRAWQGQAEDEEKVDFLREMVFSQTNGLGVLGAVAIGAVLSIPLGLGIGALPIIGFLAVESIAALFVPSSPVFREFVLRKKRAEQREQARNHLVAELRKRGAQGSDHWEQYRKMCDRVRSLERLAKSKETGLSARDVERLDDATVDYLGLWLAWHLMYERYQSTDERSLQAKLSTIEQQLSAATGVVEVRQLEKARTDLKSILDRRQGLAVRAMGLEAELLAMVDRLEELYHRVVANPRGDVSRELVNAVERMAVEEELDHAVDAELEALFRRKNAADAQAQGQ